MSKRAMEMRSNVVKSKSSNSTIATKAGLKDSTRSYLHFKRNIIKKRGVYVEHTDTMTRIGGPETSLKQENSIKSTPRPRPNKKKFLASSNILPKTKDSTQCSDEGPNSTYHQTTNPREFTRRRPATKKNEEDNDTQKKKNKSKIASNSVGNDKKIIVLQEQKEMKETSSIFSENNSANFTNLPALVKITSRDDEDEMKADNIPAPLTVKTNTANNKNSEEKQMKGTKRVRIEDPTTLVRVNNVGTQETSTKYHSKGMYNFFVDLLETIDMYNATDIEKEATLSSSKSSLKVPLEINESVANKLDVKVDSPNYECKTRNSSPGNKYYCFKDDEELRKAKLMIPKSKTEKNGPIKSDSFSVKTNLQRKKLKANSFNIDKKHSTSKKRKKHTLLNMFKEQLNMDVKAYDEPQNLYEALKIIAENKRKFQETLHLEEAMRRNRKDFAFPECTFKSPKVIKIGKKNKIQKLLKEPIQKLSVNKERETKVRRKGIIPVYTAKSQDSLQVLGYNYESPDRQSSIKAKPIQAKLEFTYHSTPPTTDGDASNDDHENTDSIFDTFRRSPSISSQEF